jgi:acetylornithine/N-succinyldiaminopimelate aminotransferase
LIHTYNRYQIVLDKGDGVHLYDTDGKEYLDFGAGIAVFALGYNNKEYNDALKAQIDKLVHTSNYFYNEPAAKAAKMLTKATGMDRVFFTNSGTEAVEGAIKLAKKYAYLKDGSTDHEIIAMEHSFHGRSMGALAVTGNKHYQEAFGPMIPGIRFAQYNNLESVKELVNGKTCAIIFETVQGEGGVYPAKKEFIEGVRKLCDKYGILMICDEVMAGFFRTGKWFAWQNFDFVPDMITFAKGVTCGYVQLGGVIVNKKVADYFEENVLQCGLTYSGHTLACAAGVAALNYYKDHDIEGHVAKMHAIVAPFMDEMVAKHKCIGDTLLVQG